MKIRSVFLALAVGMTSPLATVWWLSSASASPLDQDDVVPLVEQGKVLPLEQILKTHQPQLQGRLIDLELEYEHGRWVYELEIIDSNGVVREYLIDANTNEWLGDEQ